MSSHVSIPRVALGAALAAVAVLLLAGAAGAADPEFGPQTTTQSAMGNEIWGMATADFDQDGRDDTVTSNHDSSGAGQQALNVQFGQVDGTLGPPSAYPLPEGGAQVATGDLDADGDPDMVGSNAEGGRVFMNDGNGAFTQGATLQTTGGGGDGVAIGDFDEDDDADVVIGTSDQATVFLGDGEGAFTESGSFGFDDGSWVNQIVVADFEGDGSSDLAATLYDTENVQIFTSDGDGTFTSRGTFGSACGCGGAWGVAAADFNLDGRDDVVVGERWNNRVFTVMSQPTDPPTFVKTANVNLPNSPYDANPIWVAAGDLNGDGYPDAATADYMNDASTILVGDRTGSFTVAGSLFPTLPSGGYFASHANVIADFDGDGLNDTAVASQEPVVAAFRNVGEPDVTVDPASLDFGDQAVGAPSDPLEVEVGSDGNAPLEVTGASISGPHATQFTVDGSDCLAAPVPAGSTCTLEVTFTPTALGPASATLEVSSDDPEGEVEAPLAGNGIPPSPGISVAPTTIDFGEQKVGTASAGQTITVESSGTADLTIGAIQVQDASGGNFAVSGQEDCIGTLAPGEACELTVSFAPAAPGASSADLVVMSDATSGSSTTSLSGTGTVPEIEASPESVGFADTEVGSESAFTTIFVGNDGEAPLEVASLGKSGGQPFDFVLFPGGCDGATLAPGESCELAVAFRPSAAGERWTNVMVESDDPGGDIAIPLSGTGIAAGEPAVALSPGLVNFGDQRVGTRSAASTVTVTSAGDVALELGAIEAEGDFEVVSDDCPATLAPEADCEVTVAFAPGSAGPLDGALTVQSDASGGQARVALAGTGTTEAPARMLVSPASLDFGERTAGTASPPATVTVTNIGERTLAFGTTSLTGGQPDGSAPGFSLGGGCPAPLAHGESCTYEIRFGPAAAGPYGASLSISSSGGDATVRMSGTGVQATTPEPPPAAAPTVRFTRKPRATVRIKGRKLRRAKVAFTADQPGSTFQCSLAGRAFSACSSPRTLKNLKPGRHRFRVRATNGEGATGDAAIAKFKVVRKKK